MNHPVNRAEPAEKVLAFAALTFALELVFFKFVPDIGTAVIQADTSTLTDFSKFEQTYLVAGSVHHARFLGNFILYTVAKWLGTLHHSADVRLHPLRMAAGLLTPVYAYIGAHFALRDSLFSWRYFLAGYALMVLIGQYVFYPADMPALACVSLALYCLLRERLWPAFGCLLLTGLFRETSFHIVWLVASWAWCTRLRGSPSRLLWVGAFGVGFIIEYVGVRRFFPGPVSAAGGVIWDVHELFFSAGTLSATNLCSVGLAAVFPVACLLRVREIPRDDWRRAFFTLNAWMFPAWLVFYRMMSGNLAEFRILFPVLIPCIYGIAYAAAINQSGRKRSSDPALAVANSVS